VRLTAIPDPGNYFALWGNAVSGSQNPYYFNVFGANLGLSALFSPLPSNQVALTVLSGSGGYVVIQPFTNRYQIGTTTVLTATPYQGQTFLGWSGDATGTANPLTLIMATNKLITANFSKTSTLGILGTGGGISLS